MLSRRNVRIKVMQVLYSMERDERLKFDDAMQRYRESVDLSFELYLFTLFHYMEVARYAHQDADRKNAKLLPSEEDKRFTPKLFDNPLMRSIEQNENLQRLFRRHQFQNTTDQDLIRLVYSDFAKTDAYKAYIAKVDSSTENDREILLSLFKHCVNSENFEEFLEDHYPQWVDDKSLIVGAIKKTIKALPGKAQFFESYRPTKDTTVDFGEVLMRRVENETTDLLGLIEPTLKNWDADRVAVIDMILLKMALCELMIFPTIPAKVTLNEFVEISKLYSTDKSKDFINGILDRLMKKLENDGRIKKEGRGLME